MSRLFKNTHPKIAIWLILAIALSAIIHTKQDEFKYEVVKSDGRGYYAYLPALLLFQDADYEKVLEAERTQFKGRTKQTYLFTDQNGKKFNKYFPGVSVLQAPFFVGAVIASKLMGQPLDGYNNVFMVFLLIGSVFYTLLGILFLYKVLIRYTGDEKLSFWITGILFFATHLFFHTLAIPSFSHNYSFFLFALLMWLFQRFASDWKWQQALAIGVVTGLIFLVRPTNILMVLFLPFLLKDKAHIVDFFKKIFKLKNGILFVILISSLLIAMILPLSWKWQTGSWLVWSYDGEGFDFIRPHILQTLFGYRVGIFLHTPLLIIGSLGVLYLIYKRRFIGFYWTFYFLTLIYITSSWWCWDYESSFGHRALTEHLLIFAFPLAHILSSSYKKWMVVGIGLCVLYNGMRFYQRHTDIFPFQKFSSFTYWKSIGDFDSTVKNKYSALSHCSPLGEIVEQQELSYMLETDVLQEGDEFTPALIYSFPIERHHNRFMFEATFDKKLMSPDEDWREVFLVFDATNEKTGERIYYASPIYEYYKEGLKSVHSTTVQNEVPVTFQPMEKVSIYFWNPQHKKIQIQHFRVTLREIGH